jgi:hypothetical protein
VISIQKKKTFKKDKPNSKQAVAVLIQLKIYVADCSLNLCVIIDLILKKIVICVSQYRSNQIKIIYRLFINCF